VVLVALLSGACGSEGDSDDPDAGTPGSTNPTATTRTVAPGDGETLDFDVLAAESRGIPPTATAIEVGGVAVLSGDIDALWADWGPTKASGTPAPTLPAGTVGLLVWVSGHDVQIDRVLLLDGKVVVDATRITPAPGCGGSAEVGGTTTVLALPADSVDVNTEPPVRSPIAS
jgi:hypothetical protein